MHEKMIYEICREAKEHSSPRITNQELCELTGLSDSAINNYLRGSTKQPSVYTVGPICQALGVSLDDYFGIDTQKPNTEPDELRSELKRELAHAKQMQRIYARGVRVRTGIIFVLCAVLTLALVALIIDLCNPNVGWVRVALRGCVQL